MATEPVQFEQTEAQLRARRLIQIAGLTIAGLTVLVLRALANERLGSAGIMAAGIMVLSLCLYLNRRGSTEAANLLLVVTLSVMVGFLMWRGEGLRDSALLAFPAVLISAGLLIERRHFVPLLGAMVLAGAAIATSTQLGWRIDQPGDAVLDRAIDTTVILMITGFAVWVMIGDLQRILWRLRVQVERYREAQQNLTYLSQHDALTRLPNRILGRSRIEQALAHARRNGGNVALMFVDLDNFKSVNDSYGHTAGDEFLQQVSQRLAGVVRQTDVVSRQGGDEFLIGITDMADGDSVSTVATKVLKSLGEPFHIGGIELTSSCSIGIALFPQNGRDFETLLRNADISVGQAKDAGRNMFRLYDATMNTRLQENLQLVAGLRHALARQEFELHYQPVVDIRDGRLTGAEALIRWNRAGRGLVSPAEFIPAAERSGLIVDIGEWVLGEACRQMVAWKAAGIPDFVLAVNLSPVQFRRGNIESMVESALRVSGLAPANLELELTESTLIQDSEKFLVSLRKLKALGLRIAIDDFGTGYSNLSYLQRFAVDKLKIDQSFVRQLMHGAQEQAIVSAIIQIATSLKLTTTAEGIEDEPTRQRLLELGCNQAQGYLFARPMPADRFEAWVRGKN